MKKLVTLTPWKKIFLQVTKLCVPVVLAGTMVGAIIDGWAGLLGVLSGFLLVHLWFSIDILVATIAERKSLSQVARSLMAFYVVKVILGFVILFWVPLPTLLLSGWLLLGSVLTVAIWLGGSMQTIMKMRILYFDQHD